MSSRRIQLVLFGAVLFAHAYFYNGAFWNQNARLDSIYAFVEPGQLETGTLHIDRFIPNTLTDWAKAGAHYYSNKAPGGTFLGIPVYAALFYGERAAGVDPVSYDWVVINAYVLNLWLSVLWTAIGCVFLYRLAPRLGFGAPRDALIVAAIYGFGTLVFPFDSQVWGHPQAAALLIVGFYYLLASERRGRYVLAGAALGFAVLVEYLAGVSLVLAAAYLVLTHRRRRELVAFAVGALPFVIGLLVFQKLVLGGWLTTAAALSNPALDADHFGVPSLYVLYQLTISPERGALMFMPILAFAIAGARRLRRAEGVTPRVLCAANVVAYMVVVAGYKGWHGGASTGPRYLILALPFAVLLLTPLSSLTTRTWRRLFGAAAALSAVNMFAIAAVTTMLPESVPNPLYGVVYPRLLTGELSHVAGATHMFFTLSAHQQEAGVFNLGHAVLGLGGIASLLPLVAVLAVVGRWLVIATRAAPLAPVSDPDLR